MWYMDMPLQNYLDQPIDSDSGVPKCLTFYQQHIEMHLVH